MDDSLVQWKRPFLKLVIRETRKFPYKILTFFLGKPIAKIIFVLHSNYTGDTPYQVRFDLDDSLFWWKRPIFKIGFWEIRKFPYEKLTFFLGNLEQKLFLFYTLIALLILHTEFRLIWTTPWSDEKDLFLKLVIREIRKFPYEILTFFQRQPIAKILFVLHSNHKGDTPCRVWFDLDNSLVRWKRPNFNICNSGNTQISVWKTYFFPRQAISKILCFTLLLHWWYSIPSLVWFGQLLGPMNKTYF